ncbi:hypothetical protein DUI87_08164 [Hirundo rustica rustica]|uniref:Uncharacterized protein n=1 Tax=Hirundo rustica rustica TaxID=333673 RepID=A0A3M0L9N6_HIRRU|nr:hypothetical protein DUI87_08164 [Hirundo rustica rustica]
MPNQPAYALTINTIQPYRDVIQSPALEYTTCEPEFDIMHKLDKGTLSCLVHTIDENMKQNSPQGQGLKLRHGMFILHLELVLWQANLSLSIATHALSPGGTWNWSGKVTVRKLVDGDKDSMIGKVKAKCTAQKKCSAPLKLDLGVKGEGNSISKRQKCTIILVFMQKGKPDYAKILLFRANSLPQLVTVWAIDQISQPTLLKTYEQLKQSVLINLPNNRTFFVHICKQNLNIRS